MEGLSRLVPTKYPSLTKSQPGSGPTTGNFSTVNPFSFCNPLNCPAFTTIYTRCFVEINTFLSNAYQKDLFPFHCNWNLLYWAFYVISKPFICYTILHSIYYRGNDKENWAQNRVGSIPKRIFLQLVIVDRSPWRLLSLKRSFLILLNKMINMLQSLAQIFLGERMR